MGMEECLCLTQMKEDCNCKVVALHNYLHDFTQLFQN
jgi:hypothetical protein